LLFSLQANKFFFQKLAFDSEACSKAESAT
jgi:hypothetical protein